MKTRTFAVLAAASTLLVPFRAPAIDGSAIYARTCAQCHANGVAGAPKTGVKAEWIKRIELGRDAMLTTVIRGKGSMPPKGGNASLSNADAAAAADHMLRQVR